MRKWRHSRRIMFLYRRITSAFATARKFRRNTFSNWKFHWSTRSLHKASLENRILEIRPIRRVHNPICFHWVQQRNLFERTPRALKARKIRLYGYFHARLTRSFNHVTSHFSSWFLISGLIIYAPLDASLLVNIVGFLKVKHLTIKTFHPSCKPIIYNWIS